MSELREEICFSLALYGVAARDDDVQLLGEVDTFFSTAGLVMSRLYVRAPGFGRKLLRFGPAWKRLREAALENVDTVALCAMMDGWTNMNQWLAQCTFERDYGTFFLSVGLERMADAVERILDFALDRLARIRPGYGIGYLRERRQNPFSYAVGVGYGGGDRYEGMEYEENRLTSRWIQGINDAVYEEGVLRDVYPYNLLTARHLERDVGGLSLEAWIRDAAWRGRIEAYPHGYALWTVDADHLLDVRRSLAARHALYVMGPDNHLGPGPG